VPEELFDLNPQDSHTEDPPTVEDITSDIIDMSVVKQQKFSMDHRFPFILYDYVSDGRRRISVDFLILTVPKEMIRPKMDDTGTELQVAVVVPPFFADADRLMAANNAPGFTQDTHKATAFKEAAMKLHNHHQSFDEDDIIGNPQRIKLPFQCEEHIVEWEVQAFENDSQALTDGLGGSQFYFVLSVDLVSVVKARKKKEKGGFRVISSPGRSGGTDNMVQDEE
jgi:hypothetical protein